MKISDKTFIIILAILSLTVIFIKINTYIPEKQARTPDIFGAKKQKVLAKAYPKILHYFPGTAALCYVNAVKIYDNGYVIEFSDRCHIIRYQACFDGLFSVYFDNNFRIYKTRVNTAPAETFNDTLK